MRSMRAHVLRPGGAAVAVLMVTLATVQLGIGPAGATGTGAGTWSTVAPMPTPPRYGLAAATGGNGHIYAMGGCCDSDGNFYALNQAFNPSTNS
jgi:hypothetical protein